MKNEIRIAIVGAGNCAAALTNGLAFYRSKKGADGPGLIFKSIGPYAVTDIKPVVAFDIDDRKVGLSLGAALNSQPICVAERPDKDDWDDVPVLMGHRLDGTDSEYLSGSNKGVVVSEAPPVDVAQALLNNRVDIAINYLPVGSVQASEYYANCCLEAGVAFCNCMPTFIASKTEWAERFSLAGIPLVGDDIKSQFGASIVHRVLMQLAQIRGVRVSKTYQLNVGGNSDFLNMLDRHRLEQKMQSKRQAVMSAIGSIATEDLHVGPSDYVEWLDDNKICFIHAELQGYAGSVAHLDLKLSVQDSSNSAGCVVDAVRFLKLALDQKTGGTLSYPSAYFMKSPPVSTDEMGAYEGCRRIASGELPVGSQIVNVNDSISDS